MMTPLGTSIILDFGRPVEQKPYQARAIQLRRWDTLAHDEPDSVCQPVSTTGVGREAHAGVLALNRPYAEQLGWHPAVGTALASPGLPSEYVLTQKEVVRIPVKGGTKD